MTSNVPAFDDDIRAGIAAIQARFLAPPGDEGKQELHESMRVIAAATWPDDDERKQFNRLLYATAYAGLALGFNLARLVLGRDDVTDGEVQRIIAAIAEQPDRREQ
jgi:hypothetical protein